MSGKRKDKQKSLRTLKELLTVLREYAAVREIPIIGEDAERVLSAVASVKRPKKILEIGTAIGYSGAFILAHADQDAHLYTMDKDEEAVATARETFRELKLTDRVTVYSGDAGDILKNLTGMYDFIFLDGPKGQYLSYFPHLYEHLEPGGVLFCDNVYFHGMTNADPGHKNRTIHTNLREFLNVLQTHQGLTTEVLSCGDGIAVSVKNF